MKRIIFYISGHGFGHASRTSQVIRAFYDLCNARGAADKVKIDICSGAAPWYFEETLSGCPFSLRPVSLDIGAVQSDSLTLDVSATLHAYARLVGDKGKIVSHEVEFIKGADLVFGDIPPFCFAAAHRAGVESLAMGNFSWDWIYEPYVENFSDFKYLIDDIRADYKRAKLLLELPFAEGMDVFGRKQKIGLVSLPSKLESMQTRQLLGLDKDKPCALLSFGGIGLGPDFFSNLEKITGWNFFCSEGGTRTFGGGAIKNISRRQLKESGVCYQDMVRAADVVITKPGYGIIAECIAGRVPVIYTSRGQFREYEGLVRVIKEYLPGSGFVENERLAQADFEGELSRALQSKASPALRTEPGFDGAAQAARIIFDNMNF